MDRGAWWLLSTGVTESDTTKRSIAAVSRVGGQDSPLRRVDSLEKTLMLGGIGVRRRRGRQRMRWLDGITDLMDMSLMNSRS